MKRLKSLLSLALAILLVSAFSFTSCGGKKDSNNEAETEHVDGAEHPADGAEHPADGAEHPADGNSTEHPADSTAQ